MASGFSDSRITDQRNTQPDGQLFSNVLLGSSRTAIPKYPASNLPSHLESAGQSASDVTYQSPFGNTKEFSSRQSSCNHAHLTGLENRQDLTKTKLCDQYMKGKCNDSRCKWAHGRHELRYTNDFYKTSLCKYWVESVCYAGDACRHAHGNEELRPRKIPFRKIPFIIKAGQDKETSSIKQTAGDKERLMAVHIAEAGQQSLREKVVHLDLTKRAQQIEESEKTRNDWISETLHLLNSCPITSSSSGKPSMWNPNAISGSSSAALQSLCPPSFDESSLYREKSHAHISGMSPVPIQTNPFSWPENTRAQLTPLKEGEIAQSQVDSDAMDRLFALRSRNVPVFRYGPSQITTSPASTFSTSTGSHSVQDSGVSKESWMMSPYSTASSTELSRNISSTSSVPLFPNSEFLQQSLSADDQSIQQQQPLTNIDNIATGLSPQLVSEIISVLGLSSEARRYSNLETSQEYLQRQQPYGVDLPQNGVSPSLVVTPLSLPEAKAQLTEQQSDDQVTSGAQLYHQPWLIDLSSWGQEQPASQEKSTEKLQAPQESQTMCRRSNQTYPVSASLGISIPALPTELPVNYYGTSPSSGPFHRRSNSSTLEFENRVCHSDLKNTNNIHNIVSTTDPCLLEFNKLVGSPRLSSLETTDSLLGGQSTSESFISQQSSLLGFGTLNSLTPLTTENIQQPHEFQSHEPTMQTTFSSL